MDFCQYTENADLKQESLWIVLATDFNILIPVDEITKHYPVQRNSYLWTYPFILNTSVRATEIVYSARNM